MQHVNHQRGFTLIELLIASVIFAIMAVMAYGGLDNVIRISEASGSELDRIRQIQNAINTMNRDFSQLVKRDIRDQYGTTQPYITAGQDIDLMVELTRGGRVNPANLPRSSLLRVSYSLREDELIRLQWPQLDRAQEAEPRETVLLTRVNDSKIRFLNLESEWQDQWPPLIPTTQSGNPNELVAIEVTLQLEDWGEIRRLYAMQ